jgi:hypothetical protein
MILVDTGPWMKHFTLSAHRATDELDDTLAT